MDENKDILENVVTEESSDYFTDAVTPDHEDPAASDSWQNGQIDEVSDQSEEMPDQDWETADLSEVLSDQADEAGAQADDSSGRFEDMSADLSRPDSEETFVQSEMREEEQRAAEQKAQEEAQRAAEQKAQEEAQRASELKALEEAQRAAEQKAQEEAKKAAELKAQEEAQRAAEEKAQEKARKDAEKQAKKEARKEARAARKEALKNWVPGPQLPNQLTIARICMIPLFVVLILWVPKPVGNILAMIVFILACLTDTADGYIARRFNYVTTFGKFMDPLADKLLVCSALICLVDLGRIESWIVIIIIAREFIISGFRLVAVEKGVVIAANIWGKVKTVVQMVMVILMVGNFGGYIDMAAQVLKWAALALTLISLATYLFQNRRVLHDEVKETGVDS